MQNVEFQVEGNALMIVIDLSQELGESSSGKSVIIATTGGNVSVPGYEDVKVGLNVYRPVQQQQGNRGVRRMASRFMGGLIFRPAMGTGVRVSGACS